MTRPRRQLAEARGRRSELWAAWFLRAKGYRILAQRLRTKAGEIDLIARTPSGILCFIEVKARGKETDAVLSVGVRQQQRIARAAALYCAAHPHRHGKGVRFDIISVAPGRLPRHLRDAFRPER